MPTTHKEKVGKLLEVDKAVMENLLNVGPQATEACQCHVGFVRRDRFRFVFNERCLLREVLTQTLVFMRCHSIVR